MVTATSYAPEEFFEAFLYEQHQRGKDIMQRFNKELHRAFHQAQMQFSEVREAFDDFLIRIEPYSPRLEGMFWEFRQARIISSEDGKAIIRNADALKKPVPELERIARYICNLL